MTELHLASGFLPRVDRRNHRGVERTLAVASSQTLFGGNLELPWLLAEGPWASDAPPLLDHRREFGFRFLVDTQAWRYCHAETFEVEKFRTAPWAPDRVLDLGDRGAVGGFARATALGQRALGVDAVLIPGFVPRGRDDDVSEPTLVAIDAVHTNADREMIAFVGVHRSNLEAGLRLLDRLPAYLSSVYIQFTPVKPLYDSTELLVGMSRFLLDARGRDYQVVAGRMGAMARTLSVLGIHAADAGLAEGESFELGAKLRTTRRLVRKQERQPLPGGRVYAPHLGQSFTAVRFRALEAVPNVRPYLVCDFPCCRYAQLREAPGRAFSHALWVRRHESSALFALPRPMRFESEIRRLETVRSNRIAANHALRSADVPELNGDHIDRHLGLLHRLSETGEIAA
jgi:hypothetical protein